MEEQGVVEFDFRSKTFAGACHAALGYPTVSADPSRQAPPELTTTTGEPSR